MSQLDPIGRLAAWFDEAVAAGVAEPEAVALATATADGRPSVRMVLCRGIGPAGLRFFTNYESRKGRELAANPRAAMCFYWQRLGRQARVEGRVERLPPEDSDAYFAARPRGSRLSALASPQSQPIPDRDFLVARRAELDARYPDEVPRPAWWGGFRLVPDEIELWTNGADRLHDRLVFRLRDGAWEELRLAP